MTTRVALCASVVLGLISSAQATTTNLLTNGSLEKGAGTFNTAGYLTMTPSKNQTAITGWTITSGTVDLVSSKYWKPSAGTASVDMIGTTGLGAIQQVVSTSADTSYDFTFDLSANPDNGPLGEGSDTKRLMVQIFGANGTTVLASQTFTITKGTRTRTNMQWVLGNLVNFTADGATATIKLSSLMPTGAPAKVTSSNVSAGPVIDNLSLVVGSSSAGTPAPEPAALSILGIGASALLLKRRRGR